MIPKPSHPIVDGKPIDRYWYDALSRIAASSLSLADVREVVDGAIAGVHDADIRLFESSTIEVQGNSGAGFAISLRPLADSGVGAGLWKFTRDSFGRVSGTESATTDDLTEGSTNLYFTDERAQDATGAAIAAGTGDGVSLAYDEVANAINATNTDKGSVAVASHEAAVDPHPQYLTQAEGDARYALAGSGGSGGILPMVNGESPPQLMYFDDGSLLYARVE